MMEVKPVDSRAGLEGRFLDAFEVNRTHLSNGHGEAMAETRDRAIHVFEELGFPGTKDEAWKYTPIRRVLENEYLLSIAPDLPSSSSIDHSPYRIEGLAAHVAVFVNGVFAPDLSRIDGDVLSVIPLLDAVDHPSFRRLFARRTDELKEVFSTLNTAFARNGLFVHARPGKPDALHVINLTQGTSDIFVQPRHLIVADDEATLTVVETHVGEGGVQHFTNAVAECFVGARARLDYYRVQDDPGMSGVTTSLLHQKDSSYASCTTITLSGGTIRNNVNVLPEAQFCESHLVGLFLGRGDMHVDNHTMVDHAVPDCFSNELYKGILADRSRQQNISVEEARARAERDIPLGRANTPEDIAAMAVFLASPASRNVTGQAYNVDGGLVPS